MSPNAVRRLRPHLFTACRQRTSRAFSRAPYLHAEARDVTHDYEKRVAELEAQRPLSEWYPRLPRASYVSVRKVLDGCNALEAGETDDGEAKTVTGRVHSVRRAGSKLFFMDVKETDAQGSSVVQVVGDLGKLGATPADTFKHFVRTARRGDWCTVTGYTHKTSRGEPSIMATQLPDIVSPSLHQIPAKLDDPETKARVPHASMLVNPEAIQVTWLSHFVDQTLRHYFVENGFTGVRTPLLTAGAGGAVARPFETEATELEGQTLNLRIAPELWLKRLVIGGLTKVYEIGPAFRNEGVDATHNPEFNICEFYEAFATLDRLMDRTQDVLKHVNDQVHVERLIRDFSNLTIPNFNFTPSTQFPRLEFIPSIEKALGEPLPDLSSPNEAQTQLLDLFTAKNIAIPGKPTLPRLLDALAGHYLEPFCQDPTFIIHQPAALSPLSKHFVCPHTGQTVAARAELFIQGHEYANMYEEENSPFEQRRKFEEQLRFREVDGESDGSAEVDESYLEALEWGLPPTGGWGCGVDRLVMLFSGQERIADVLPFGSLRNVVGLGKRRGWNVR